MAGWMNDENNCTRSFLAWAYLWYTPESYSTTASLKFNEDRSELTELVKSTTPYYDRTNKVQAEMFVIQSRRVILNAISRIDYKISYFLKGRIRTTDIYPQAPFPIEIIRQDSVDFFRGFFDVKRVGEKAFKLTYETGGKIEKVYRFGDTIQAPGICFRVKGSVVSDETLYSFKFNTKEDFLSRAMGGLSMREASKSSNVLLLTQTDQNRSFASDILIDKSFAQFRRYLPRELQQLCWFVLLIFSPISTRKPSD